jgi:inner membrane protein
VPSIFTHAAAALALGTAFRAPSPPARFWVAGALCAVVPDLDAFALRFVPYEHLFGHRGITHSIAFAAVFAAVVVALAFRSWPGGAVVLWTYLWIATASHGVLDMFTNGGGGVALLAPFTDERLFFPWRPILVSPMSASRFFTERGARVFASELRWVWLPCAVLAVVCIAARRRHRA